MGKNRNDIKELRKAQREAAAQKERARDRRNLILMGSGLGVAALAILVIAAALGHAPDSHMAFAAQPSGRRGWSGRPRRGDPAPYLTQ